MVRRMRMATLTIALACAVAAVTAVPATARTRVAHAGHRHARYERAAAPVVLRGRTPAYAPPAPIGVGLFGTGLFYGYGFPDAAAFGF